MKIEIQIPLERFRYSLVGDGYTLDEVKEFSAEKLKGILETRIISKIDSEYYKGKRMGLFETEE